MSQTNPNSAPLRQSLSRLHDELARSPTLDDGLRKLLTEVLGDIESLLHGAQSASAAPPVAQSRLESLAIEFEAEHPSLAASVRQFVDLLGRAGV